MIDHKTVIGIDVGLKNIHGGVYYADDFHMIYDSNVKTPETFEEVLDEIKELIHNLRGNDTVAAGISFQNPVSPVELDNLRDETGLPIFADTNIHLFTLAEYEKNWKHKTKNFAGVFLGTNLRAGLIVNGELSSAHYGFSGQNHPEAAAFHREFEDFMTGEKGSKELMGKYVGFYLGNLIHDYKPEAVVIAGPRRKDFAKIQKNVWEEIQQRTVPENTGKLLIEVSKLQNASTLGAAILAAKHTLA